MVVLKRNDPKDATHIDDYGDKWFVGCNGSFNWCDNRWNDRSIDVLGYALKPIKEEVMKEYLFKYNDQYTLVELSKDDAESNPEQYIEVPDGSEKLTSDESKTLTFWKSEYESMNVDEGNFWVSSKSDDVLTFSEYSEYPYTVLWQREKESIIDKIDLSFMDSGELPEFKHGVDATLAERQAQYGCFEDVAFVTENIMSILSKVRSNGLQDLPHPHRMAL